MAVVYLPWAGRRWWLKDSPVPRVPLLSRITNGQWQARPLSQCAAAYRQLTFTASPEWEGQTVFLQFGGVDGLAEVCLNGRRLAWLPSWEPAAYDVSAKLRYGEPNTLTVLLPVEQGKVRPAAPQLVTAGGNSVLRGVIGRGAP